MSTCCRQNAMGEDCRCHAGVDMTLKDTIPQFAADRIKELEAKLAKVIAAYRIEVMQRGPWVSHEDFDRHIREITGDHDE